MVFKYDETSVQVTRVLLLIVQMTMKKIKKTKIPHITMYLIGNYHYGFNIEHAKSVFEKGLIVNSLLGDITTAFNQAERREGGPAGFLVYVSKSNLNNFERALKKFKASIGI